jgi:hypothetical protein
VLPDSGWASYWIKSDADIEKIIELFRIQYERLGEDSENNCSYHTERNE